MPLCHERKICFIHIPKTGGSSIINYFNFHRDLHHMFGMDGNLERTHFCQSEIEKHFEISDYYKFVFVRNPYERIASEFAWRMMNLPNKHGLLSQYDDFNEFVIGLDRIYDEIINNQHIHRICNHFFPQNKFFNSVDFIGRYENYELDLGFLGKKFGIEKKIPHDNKAKNEDYRTWYNERSIEIISRLYSEDIKIFGYENYFS